MNFEPVAAAALSHEDVAEVAATLAATIAKALFNHLNDAFETCQVPLGVAIEAALLGKQMSSDMDPVRSTSVKPHKHGSKLKPEDGEEGEQRSGRSKDIRNRKVSASGSSSAVSNSPCNSPRSSRGALSSFGSNLGISAAFGRLVSQTADLRRRARLDAGKRGASREPPTPTIDVARIDVRPSPSASDRQSTDVRLSSSVRDSRNRRPCRSSTNVSDDAPSPSILSVRPPVGPPPEKQRLAKQGFASGPASSAMGHLGSVIIRKRQMLDTVRFEEDSDDDSVGGGDLVHTMTT